MPERADPSQPCVYAVLASVFPPGAPYEPKPAGSMFGASFFADIDFERSNNNAQFFRQDENDVELSGMVLKLTVNSSLVLDIKKMDLTNGLITDYGFAIQPLIHHLKDKSHIIGGRYQMPVYRGSLPRELLKALLKQ